MGLITQYFLNRRTIRAIDKPEMIYMVDAEIACQLSLLEGKIEVLRSLKDCPETSEKIFNLATEMDNIVKSQTGMGITEIQGWKKLIFKTAKT